jgi:AraC-like DNA-binding protein
MDALSELLRAAKISGAMFFDGHCAAPWCIRSPKAQTFGRFVGTPTSRIIEFHLVTVGRAYIRVGQETTPLAAGDIAMLPHGDEHFMGNGYPSEIIDAAPDLARYLKGELTLSRIGSGMGEQTRLICGYLACEAGLIQPVLAGLPHVVRVHVRSDGYGELLEGMIREAVEQVRSAAPGGKAIAARLAEVLFTEVLRRYVLSLPAGRTGWLSAAADPAVGRALAALHAQPERAWTLDTLAETAGLSRSTLSERFARCIGQAPMAYLADWRLEIAAETLRTTSRNVLQVAGDVGYESEAAFNRAFKRRFGEPPARYRREHRAALRDGADSGARAPLARDHRAHRARA